MLAVGYTSDGYRKEFRCSDCTLYCYNKDLVSLEVPKGVKYVWCINNKLTKLIITEGVKYVWCNNNQLTELKLPESVTMLSCDKEIKGLEEFIGKIEIELW